MDDVTGKEVTKVDQASAEYVRLASKPELKTLLVQAVGPVVSMLTAALYGIVTTIWISRAIGNIGMAAVSTYSAFDQIGRSFGAFLSVAASSEISTLYGSGKGEETPQVFADIIRISIICGIIIPAVLLPSIKPAAEWFGATDEVINEGWDYMLPLMICSFSSVMFMGVGGVVQGEGRAMIYGAQNMINLVLNMVVLCPLFLFDTNWGIRGASIATIVSEAIPLIGILFCFYLGKFTTKPHFRDFFRPFSPYTLPAIKVGSSQLIAQLSIMLPSVFVRKFLGMALTKADYNDAMAGYNAAVRTSGICSAVDVGIAMAFIPAASFALAAGMPARWIKLTIHSIWINFVWGAITMIITFSLPDELALMYASGDKYLEYASPMLWIINALGCLTGVRYNMTSILQSLKKGLLAMILSVFSQFASVIAFAAILYYTGKHNPNRIIWSYSLASVFGLVLAVIFLTKPIYVVYKMSKEDGDENVLGDLSSNEQFDIDETPSSEDVSERSEENEL